MQTHSIDDKKGEFLSPSVIRSPYKSSDQNHEHSSFRICNLLSLLDIFSTELIASSFQTMFKFVETTMITVLLHISILARRTGQIFKPVVSAPCKDDYCIFYKNTTAHLYFSFSISKSFFTLSATEMTFPCLEKKAQKVRAKIVATIGSVDHDFFIPNHDACEQLHCPLKPNTRYSYYHSMFVSPTYPSVLSSVA